MHQSAEFVHLCVTVPVRKSRAFHLAPLRLPYVLLLAAGPFLVIGGVQRCAFNIAPFLGYPFCLRGRLFCALALLDAIVQREAFLSDHAPDEIFVFDSANDAVT